MAKNATLIKTNEYSFDEYNLTFSPAINNSEYEKAILKKCQEKMIQRYTNQKRHIAKSNQENGIKQSLNSTKEEFNIKSKRA